MINLILASVLSFSPGDKIVWGDKISNSSETQLNGQYQCKGLVIKQDGKLLHVKGMCYAPLGKDIDKKIVYIGVDIDDYITTEDVKSNE